MSEYKSDLRITIKAQAAVRGFIQRQKGALNKNPNDAVQNQVIEVMQPVESRRVWVRMRIILDSKRTISK